MSSGQVQHASPWTRSSPVERFGSVIRGRTSWLVSSTWRSCRSSCESHEIDEAFKPDDDRTTVGKQAESGPLNDLFDKIVERQIIWRKEIERLSEAFYRNKPSRGKDNHSRLYV